MLTSAGSLLAEIGWDVFVPLTLGSQFHRRNLRDGNWFQCLTIYPTILMRVFTNTMNLVNRWIFSRLSCRLTECIHHLQRYWQMKNTLQLVS